MIKSNPNTVTSKSASVSIEVHPTRQSPGAGEKPNRHNRRQLPLPQVALKTLYIEV